MSPLINLKKRQINNKCLRFSNVGKLTQVDPRNCKSIPLNTSLEQTFVLFPGQRHTCQLDVRKFRDILLKKAGFH